MNRYGVQAMRAWQDLAPTALATMDDPSRHFSRLGEEAMEQVTSLTIELSGPDVAGETYFEKVGRIENARLRAEEMVRAYLLVPPPDVRDLSEEDLEDLEPDEGQQAIAEMWRLLQENDETPDSPSQPPSEPAPPRR